ncbi:YeiH family protein [Nocardioides pacificus]
MPTEQLNRVPADLSARVAGPSLIPGLVLAAAGAAVSLAAHRLVPALSPVLVAIVLGALVANAAGLPHAVRPGLGVVARRVLRVGVALLGLQLVLADVVALGWPMLVVIGLVVGGGIAGTLALGRALGVAPGRRLLIACGFSICGAAAIAAVDGVRARPAGPEAQDGGDRDADVASVIALAVASGSAAMLLVPVLGVLLELAPAATGAWSGAAVHEVGQVVVAGGLVAGGAGLQAAVTVKLGRVLLLAPVLGVLSWRERRTTLPGARPPLVPLFVAAFLGCVVLRTLTPLPAALLDAAATVQTGALVAAMFAVGCSVDARVLRRVGRSELLLAAGATVLVLLLALPAAYVAGQG